MKNAVILKPGRERSLLQRHPWIFSGAVERIPHISPGDLLSVFSSQGEFLATAYFNPANSLMGRVLTFREETVESALKRQLKAAWEMRQNLFLPKMTNAYRLINAEGDGLPGLIVDCYADVVVIQIHTCGMEKLKTKIVAELVELLHPKAIYEKSQSAARKQEGLEDTQGLLWGTACPEVEVFERGMRFIVSVIEGQKTGFFLDQREMRRLVQEHAQGRRLLNCFSYTGAFSLFALQGGATHAESVDLSEKALALAQRNSEMNQFSAHSFVREDVFEYLKKSKMDFDFVILDPPAFVKKRTDLDQACKGYKEINRLVLEKIPAKSLLLTSSCSYYMNEELFQTLLFQAACDAKRQVKILSHHHQALDHPVSLYHPEGAYLKSLFLYIEA
jgi:23S rRNA (cytosine1962-C5)-methyltransferase